MESSEGQSKVNQNGRSRKRKKKKERSKRKKSIKKKRIKRKKPKKNRTMEVKRVAKKWEIWDKEEEVAKSEEEAKKLISQRFYM